MTKRLLIHLPKGSMCESY